MRSRLTRSDECAAAGADRLRRSGVVEAGWLPARSGASAPDRRSAPARRSSPASASAPQSQRRRSGGGAASGEAEVIGDAPSSGGR